MKTKIFTFILLVFSLLNAMNVLSQAIPNSSFENWTTTTYYEDPPPYITTNINTYMMLGTGNVTKSTDHISGLYSARLETVQLGTDTMFGGMFIGIPGSGGITGGEAMAVHPDSLSVSAKYNLQPDDTAYVLVLFKKNGLMIGVGAFAFAGTQNTFLEFKTPVTWYQTDSTDTVAAIITSSALDPPQFPGSTLFVDNLNFIGSAAPFPNGGFEIWSTTTSEDPDNWTTMNYASGPSDPSVSKTTDSYDGTYAAKIKNVQMLSGDTMGFLTNGYLGNNGPQGGMHVLQNPEKITGYYKYSPVGPDTALAGCFVYIQDSTGAQVLVDSGMIKFPAASSYTYFEIPFVYNDWPIADTLNISFVSGNLQDGGSYVGLGSELYIDMLGLTYYPVSIPETSEMDNSTVVYPNPSAGNFTVTFFSGEPEYVFGVFDAKGILIHYKTLKPVNGYYFYSFDMNGYAKGMYTVKFTSVKNSFIKKIIID
ncbi:MAG: T9SS type A sorting domain-containing protein [Bacteroidota bacterium]